MVDLIKRLPPEEKLLISLCRLVFSEEQKKEISLLMNEIKDWDHFVNLANEHGIIALCRYNITGTGNNKNLPAAHLEKLHSAYLKNLTHNTFLYKQFEEIVVLAKKENITIIPLKGIVLEKSLYGNQGLRQLSDIDILVRKEDAIAFRNILLKNGFDSIPIISPLHNRLLLHLKLHLPAMYKNGALVEIHIKLFEDPENSFTEVFFDKAINTSENEKDLFYPHPQLHFLYLVKHLERHEKTDKFQLKFYVDLYALLLYYPDQIINEQLFVYARKANLVKALSEKLKLLESVWGISLPGCIKSYTGIINPENIIEKFNRLLRYPGDKQSLEERDSLFKPLNEIPGVLNKALFIIGYVFPSFEYLKYKYHAKNRIGALLFYPVRWWQIMKLASGRRPGP